MKSTTMMINGFSIEVTEELVGLDTLENNSSNPRDQADLAKNGKRIYESMLPDIDGNRVDRFRPDKFSMFVVKSAKTFKTLTGNSSLLALREWSDEYPDLFLDRFPNRMIPVTVCEKLKPLETLAVISDHSERYRSEELSKAQTAGQVKRSMALRKNHTVATVCSDLGYSSGKVKPYFALETARLNNEVLYDVLYDGVILGNNLIRLTHLVQIAALWTPSKGRTDLPSNRFGEDNKPLWKAIKSCRDFGKIDATEKILTAIEKADIKIGRLETTIEECKEFGNLLSSAASSDPIQALLDAVILCDIGKVNVRVRELTELVKV